MNISSEFKNLNCTKIHFLYLSKILKNTKFVVLVCRAAQFGQKCCIYRHINMTNNSDNFIK